MFKSKIFSALTSARQWVLKLIGLMAVGLFALAVPGLTQAGPVTIGPGWDFLQTISGTQFNGVDFKGVPFGNVDISTLPGVWTPAPIGVLTGNNSTADTIVYRSMNPGNPFIPGPPVILNDGGSFTTPILMTAMQLVSTIAFDPDGAGGAPLGIYYATQSATMPSTGSMTITNDTGLSDGGTFTSLFDVFVDLSLTNPYLDPNAQIVATLGDKLAANGVWSKSDSTEGGFRIAAPFNEEGLLASHMVKPVSEPATLALFGAGLILLGYSRRRKMA